MRSSSALPRASSRYLNSQGWGHDTVIDSSAHPCQLPLPGRHFQRQQMLVPALPAGASELLFVPSVKQADCVPTHAEKKTLLYSPWATASGRKSGHSCQASHSRFQTRRSNTSTAIWNNNLVSSCKRVSSCPGCVPMRALETHANAAAT